MRATLREPFMRSADAATKTTQERAPWRRGGGIFIVAGVCGFWSASECVARYPPKTGRGRGLIGRPVFLLSDIWCWLGFTRRGVEIRRISTLVLVSFVVGASYILPTAMGKPGYQSLDPRRNWAPP